MAAANAKRAAGIVAAEMEVATMEVAARVGAAAAAMTTMSTTAAVAVGGSDG